MIKTIHIILLLLQTFHVKSDDGDRFDFLPGERCNPIKEIISNVLNINDCRTSSPSTSPSSTPSVYPSLKPSAHPSSFPSSFPSSLPSLFPTTTQMPSENPSITPSFYPSKSFMPSDLPTVLSSRVPSLYPTRIPSQYPSTTVKPSLAPSHVPSSKPSISFVPTHFPQNKCNFSRRLEDKTECNDRILTSSQESDRTLLSDEFLCSPNKQYRFGLTTDLFLCLCHYDLKIWCADDAFGEVSENPVFQLQDNGKLFVYEDDKRVWRENIKRYRKMEEGALVVTNDGNLRLQEYEDSSCIFWEADKDAWDPYVPPEPTPYPSFHPSLMPSVSLAPTINLPNISFYPGELHSDISLGMRLSEGLTARVIGQTGRRVLYSDGSRSLIPVHGQPDAGGCFDQPDGGWIYVSNAELPEGQGGVGAFTFDKYGNLTNYKMVQTGSSMNCGGGNTPWGTWFTGEEISGDALTAGGMWEIDPTGQRRPRITRFGRAKFESAICDDRDMSRLQCFATVDSSTGALRRWRPSTSVLNDAEETGDYSNVMHEFGGTLRYLVLDSPTPGRYGWTTNLGLAEQNAELKYPNAEGIDHHDGKLYFVSKALKMLFILDLDTGTYRMSSTLSGAFNQQPDQIMHIIGDDPKGDSFIFFLEDGGAAPGVFGRNMKNEKVFTILEKIPDEQEGDETTGLAFCDNHRRMIVAFQDTGKIYEITRDDQRPFYGSTVNIKYHDVQFNKEGQPSRFSVSADEFDTT